MLTIKGNVNGTLAKWSQNEYCITFDPSASNDTELRGKPIHLICTDGTGVNKWCDAYQTYVYPKLGYSGKLRDYSYNG